MTTALDALRLAVADCPAARGHLPDGLTNEGVANRLRSYGIGPVTLRQGTPEQIAEWRAMVGTASGSHAPAQIKLDSIACQERDKRGRASGNQGVAGQAGGSVATNEGDRSPPRRIARHGKSALAKPERGFGW